MFPQRSTYRPTDGLGHGGLGAMGAYYANTFEQPINGLGACSCARATGALVGDDSSYPSPGKVALACGAAAVVVLLALRIKL